VARMDVIMPQMGDSIAEGTVSRWLKKVGDVVKRDEALFEISTDKVDASETAAVPAVSVRQRILAMSHEEIIRMITDGEAVIESSKTTIISAPPTPAQLPHGDELRGAGKEIKTQVVCNKVEQLPAPDPAAIR